MGDEAGPLRPSTRRSRRRQLVALAVAVLTLAGAVAALGPGEPDADQATASRTTGATTPLTIASPGNRAGERVPEAAPTTAKAPFPIARLDLELPVPDAESFVSLRTARAVAWYPAIGRDGGYPLVVFAHGFATVPETYEALLTEVAAQGFVLVAPQSRPTRTSVIVPDLDDEGALIGEHEELATDFRSQRDDLVAAIDDVLGGHVPDQLRAVVGRGPVGVVGHSDGGIAAAALGFNTAVGDARVGAGVVISGAYGSFAGSWFPEGSPALLALHGDADDVNPFSSSVGLYSADSGGAKYLVDITGGGHLQPLLDDATRPALATLIARFLAAYLHGEHTEWRALVEAPEANEVWSLVDAQG